MIPRPRREAHGGSVDAGASILNHHRNLDRNLDRALPAELPAGSESGWRPPTVPDILFG
jgi:hypothetical protein